MKKENKGTDITLSLLLVAFVVLKLCGVIDWPWIWVLSPIWIPLVIAGIVLLAVFGWKAIKDKWDDKHLDAEAKKFKEEREQKKKIAKLCRDIAEGVGKQ